MWIYDEFGNRKWIPNTRFSRVMSRVFKKDDDDGGAGGGGGDEETLEQKIAKAVATATAGLQTKNQQLLDDNVNAKKIAKQLESLGGAERLTQLSEFQKRIEQDEILKLHSEGKHDEANKKVTERLSLEFNEKTTALNTQLQEKETEVSNYKEQLNKFILDGAADSTFLAEEGEKTAIDDVRWRIRQVFKVEDGKPVARDQNNALLTNAAGGELTVKDYVQALRKTAPHLFPRSEGANTRTGADGKGLTKEARLVAAGKVGAAELRRVEAQIAEEEKKGK